MEDFDRRADHRKSKIMKIEERWKILFNQTTRPPMYTVQQYIENLKWTVNNLEKNPMKINEPSRATPNLIRRLKMDLQMSFLSFVEDFMEVSLQGMKNLLRMLRLLQKLQEKSANARANKSKASNLKRLLTDEYDTLVCIKFCFRIQSAGQYLIEEPYGLETVASSLMSSFSKSRILAIEIMSLVLPEKTGYQRNLDCFTHFRLKNCEAVRFRFFINMLMSSSSSNISFQVCGMRFLNALLSNTPDFNERIYIQSELKMAGLDITSLRECLNLSSGTDATELRHELDDYQRHLVDINKLLQERLTLETDKVHLQYQVASLKDQILPQYEEKQTEEEKHSVFIPTPPGDPPPSTDPTKVPLIFAEFPYLNWTPIPDAKGTVFENMKNDAIMTEADLQELVDLFSLPVPKVRRPSTQARKKDGSSFISTSKEFYLAIFKKICGSKTAEVLSSIRNMDPRQIPDDLTEVLIKLSPTDEELALIALNSSTGDDLSNDDKLFVQICRIDCFEQRAKVLRFMSRYHSMVLEIEKIIGSIQQASSTVCNNLKLREIFEVLLFLLNMVSPRRGVAAGFHVPTLSVIDQMRTRDKSKTLLDFFVKIVHKNYAENLHWYLHMNLPQIDPGSLSRVKRLLKEMKEEVEVMEDLTSKICMENCKDFCMFYKKAIDKNESLQHFARKTFHEYADVCQRFGENPAVIEPNAFFAHFQVFAEKFKNCVKNLSSTNRIGEGNERFSPSIPDEDYSDSDTSIPESLSDPLYHEISEFASRDQGTRRFSVDSNIKALRTENWIINTRKESLSTEVLSDQMKCRHDVESFDSAFGGSEGNLLKPYGNKSRKKLLSFFGDLPCSSTIGKSVGAQYANFPHSQQVVRKNKSGQTEQELRNSTRRRFSDDTTRRKSQSYSNRHESAGTTEGQEHSYPQPDYSVCSTDVDDHSVKDDERELSRILNEFEGHLNREDVPLSKSDSKCGMFCSSRQQTLYPSTLVVHL